MVRYKFVHTGDLHLGCGLKTSSLPEDVRNNLRLDVWKALNQIVSYCKEKRVDFLFIAGDLFEHDLFKMSDLKMLAAYFKSLDKTKVFISPGNHDPLGGFMSYKAIDWPENIHIFKDEKITEVKVDDWMSVWGFGWNGEYIRDAKDVLGDVPDVFRTNILVLHGDAIDSGSNYLPLRDEMEYLNSFDYVALGHIHKPNQLGAKIKYCGSPLSISFKDEGKRGFIKGDVTKGEVTSEFIPLEFRQFHLETVEVVPEESYLDICDKIKKLSHNKNQDLFKITVNGILDVDVDFEMIKQGIYDSFYYVELIDTTIKDYDLESLYSQNENNIIGRFIKEMAQEDLNDSTNRQALYHGLEALLQERQL